MLRQQLANANMSRCSSYMCVNFISFDVGRHDCRSVIKQISRYLVRQSIAFALLLLLNVCGFMLVTTNRSTAEFVFEQKRTLKQRRAGTNLFSRVLHVNEVSDSVRTQTMKSTATLTPTFRRLMKR
ncbi:hypothetical protein JOB18_000635 [Solea senegalensis]|uniref:Transmembrane protein n=1 Tax=Solea senegalensis TaxID=28829 RepID=A0AAV6RA57_SOLSE|nr:hypothetical protein JOB18_000635 [Solea senegalensis]